MNKLKTRHVDRHLYVNFLKRAVECMNAAKMSLEEKNYSASAICSVHSAIAGIDALCTYFMQLRHSGYDHRDAAKLMESVKGIKTGDLNEATGKYVRIMNMKYMAEYEERLIKSKEAEKLCVEAGELLEFVISNLPK